ncbi:MAG: hypothetical protein ACHQLA_00555 [Ignavibacteriales bacterium]
MKKKKVSCKNVMKHICESLCEDLNDERCVEIKNHLESCANCKQYFRSVEITIDCYRKYNVQMPGEVHGRLMKILGLD